MSATTWTTLLLTGLRGNGKTLMAVSMMDEFIQAGTAVFASNFEALTLPGVQFLDRANDWQDLPAGSILFVDEAQRFWRSRRSGEPPSDVIAMETQRHDGVRIVLLTQQPSFLDKHVRGLVDVHRHLVRRAGLQAAQVYQWERCKEEPESPANLDLADATIWTFPKKFFGTYKSAEVHTVKARLPTKLKFMAVAALAVLGMLWWAVHSFGSDSSSAEGSDIAGSSAEGDALAMPSHLLRTAEGIDSSLKPRIAGATWTAPIYDGELELQQPAKLACMIGSSCICLTDQGTRYMLPQPECRLLVKNGGIYNPYLPSSDGGSRGRSRGRKEGESGRGAGDSPAAMASNGAASSPNTAIEGEQVSGYGDLGVANKPGTAP